MKNKVVVTPLKERFRLGFIFIILIVMFLISFLSLDLDGGKFIERLGNATGILSKFLVLNISHLPTIFSEMLLSICMAIAALFIGTILSLVLAFLGSDNITPNQYLAAGIKSCVSIIRGIPGLVWVLLIVASIGFGASAGVLGLIFPTTGYLTKSFISSIEGQGTEMIDTLKTTGASRGQIIFEGLLPLLFTAFLSWIAIRLEGNIAESISLGMVGAGGVGTLLTKAIAKYDYQLISTTILCIFITMFLVEIGTNRLKKTIQ